MYFYINDQPVFKNNNVKAQAYELNELVKYLRKFPGHEACFVDVPGFGTSVAAMWEGEELLLGYAGKRWKTSVRIDEDNMLNVELFRWSFDSSTEEYSKIPISLDENLMPSRDEMSSEQSTLFGALKRIAHEWIHGQCQ